MLRYIAPGVLSITALIVGCGAEQPSGERTKESLHAETFVGVLPCADCAGIRNELTLYTEEHSGRPTKYRLTETYLGTREGDRTFSHEGRWTVLRGSASDQDATVYQLDYDKSPASHNFLKVSDDELRLLDREQRERSRRRRLIPYVVSPAAH